MANILFRDGYLHLQFRISPNGERKTFSIGKVSQYRAMEFKERIEALVDAIRADTPPDRSTIKWLSSLPDHIYSKMARTGLVEPRAVKVKTTTTRINPDDRIVLDRVPSRTTWPPAWLADLDGRAVPPAFAPPTHTVVQPQNFVRSNLCKFPSATGESVMKWRDDHAAEQWFTKHGIKWKVNRTAVSEINRRSSIKLNARLTDQLNSELVSDYVAGMRSGDEFPRIVLWQSPSDGLIVVSGNHRLEAVSTCGEKTVEAYMMLTNDLMLVALFARSINRKLGGRQSSAEAAEQACEFISEFRVTVADAAKMFSVSESAVRDSIAAKESRAVLVSSGLRAQNLSKECLVTLGALRKDEDALKAVGTLAIRSGLNGTALKDVVKNVKRQKSHSARQAVIAEVECDLVKKHATSGRRVRVASEFRRYLSAMLNIVACGNNGRPFTSLVQLGITETSDIESVKTKWNELKKTIDGLHDLHECKLF